jgi:hypothetical protein
MMRRTENLSDDTKNSNCYNLLPVYSSNLTCHVSPASPHRVKSTSKPCPIRLVSRACSMRILPWMDGLLPVLSDFVLSWCRKSRLAYLRGRNSALRNENIIYIAEVSSLPTRASSPFDQVTVNARSLCRRLFAARIANGGRVE